MKQVICQKISTRILIFKGFVHSIWNLEVAAIDIQSVVYEASPVISSYDVENISCRFAPVKFDRAVYANYSIITKIDGHSPPLHDKKRCVTYDKYGQCGV